jgi:hypothetical protein
MERGYGREWRDEQTREGELVDMNRRRDASL